MPDAFVPVEADGLIERKLQSGLPSAWGMVTRNRPARSLGVAGWLALGTPQVSACARASAGAPSSNRDAVRWIMFRANDFVAGPAFPGQKPDRERALQAAVREATSTSGGMGRYGTSRPSRTAGPISSSSSRTSTASSNSSLVGNGW